MSENKEIQKNEVQGNGIQSSSEAKQTSDKKVPKKRAVLATVLVVIYSVVLVFATIKIDRVVLAKQMEKAVASAFGVDESTDEDKKDKGKNQVADSIGAKAIKVNFGETITNDTLEIVIDTASTSQEIKPSDTSSVYSYIADKDGETYFFLTGNLKNIAGTDYDVDELNLDFCFDEKYNYTGRVLIDVGENDFYNTNVKPLQTVKYYMYASIPDEMINSYSTCTIQFAVKENAYEITVTK